MLNNSVFVEVLQSLTARLGKHVGKLKHADKRENTLDILTLMLAKDAVKFYKAYEMLPIDADEALQYVTNRLAKHAAMWPNDGDLQALIDAESFLHATVSTDSPLSA